MKKIKTTTTNLKKDGDEQKIIKVDIEGYEYKMYGKLPACISFDGDFWSATDCLTGYLLTLHPFEKRKQVIEKLKEIEKDITLAQYKKTQERALTLYLKYI